MHSRKVSAHDKLRIKECELERLREARPTGLAKHFDWGKEKREARIKVLEKEVLELEYKVEKENPISSLFKNLFNQEEPIKEKFERRVKQHGQIEAIKKKHGL